VTDPLPHDAATPDDIPFARPIPVEFPAPALAPPRSEILLPHLTPRSAWADVGWLVISILVLELFIGLVVQVVATVVCGIPVSGIETADPAIRRVLLFMNLGLRGTGWVAAVLWLTQGRRQNLAYIGLRSDGRIADVGLGLVTVVGIYAFIVVGAIVIQVAWPELFKSFERNADEIRAVLPRLEPYQFAAVSLAVGVYEEVVFRGFLLPRLRRATGSWTFAVLLSSAVFTALHMFDQTAGAMLLIGFLSLTFSTITILRRSILPAMIAHFLFDFSQFYGLYVQAGDSWK